MHIHLGHHFYGAGNLGDDLMLDGFLAAARSTWAAGARLTCCSPHDVVSQRRRFPEIEWLSYTPHLRRDCIARSDVWLGLGGTPIQGTGGNTWFLDHLCEEAAWCSEVGKPMYYLGVGVDEREAVALPQVAGLIARASRIWTRDEQSAELLADHAPAGRITAHADLAHIALADVHFEPSMSNLLGIVLNFEKPGQYQIEDLAELVTLATPKWEPRWLVQEVRPLEGSETWLYARLGEEMRSQLPLKTPDYAGAQSSAELIGVWGSVQTLLSSRYHASLIGAWMGACTAIFARSAKVAGAARQLGLPTFSKMSDTDDMLQKFLDIEPVPRSLLLNLAARARTACNEFFEAAATHCA